MRAGARKRAKGSLGEATIGKFSAVKNRPAAVGGARGVMGGLRSGLGGGRGGWGSDAVMENQVVAIWARWRILGRSALRSITAHENTAATLRWLPAPSLTGIIRSGSTRAPVITSLSSTRGAAGATWARVLASQAELACWRSSADRSVRLFQ